MHTLLEQLSRWDKRWGGEHASDEMFSPPLPSLGKFLLRPACSLLDPLVEWGGSAGVRDVLCESAIEPTSTSLHDDATRFVTAGSGSAHGGHEHEPGPRDVPQLPIQGVH